MKKNLLPLVLAALAIAIASSRAASCDCCKAPATLSGDVSASTEAPKKYPLKGVITDLVPDESALMVKHEAIPGVMKAMTMMFTVDPAVLQAVKKGDAITGLLSHADGKWLLESVVVVKTGVAQQP